jgi:hypothetical protein
VVPGNQRAGRPATAKIESLGLNGWFAAGNINISGDYGEVFQNSSAGIIENLHCFQTRREPGNVVNFGDRDVDRQFASECGFMFRQVRVMTGVIE